MNLDRLAQDLYDEFRHADPVGDPEWAEAPEDVRDLYRHVIKRVLQLNGLWSSEDSDVGR